jgi:hypothetical protein
LADGELTHEVPASAGADGGEMEWLAGPYALFSGRHLFDFQRRAVVWRYETHGTRRVRDSLDGKYWCVAADPDSRQPGLYLGAVTLPDADVKRRTEDLRPAKTQTLINLDQLGESPITLRGLF